MVYEIITVEYLTTLYTMFGHLTKSRRPVSDMLKNKNK